MQSSPARVLIVANRTAATGPLLEAVRERAARGRCEFTLLVPTPPHGSHRILDRTDGSTNEADAVLEIALPRLEEAAGATVEGVIGGPHPLAAIRDAISSHGFDEVIISTLPRSSSRWLEEDLPGEASGLGVPVTTVVATDRGAVAS